MSCPAKPMKEIWSTVFSGTSNTNFPSMSVIVPIVASFTRTFAPITVSPEESFTTPAIRLVCCAYTLTTPNNRAVNNSRILCFSIYNNLNVKKQLIISFETLKPIFSYLTLTNIFLKPEIIIYVSVAFIS